MKRILILLAVVPLLAADAQKFLSLSSAMKLALENDTRLLPGKAAWQLAQLRQESPGVWRDPEARFETGLNSDEPFLDSALRFYLPNPWEVRSVSMENASLTATAEAEYRMGGVATAAEVHRMYREFQCLEKEILLADRLTGIKQELASLSDKRVKAGMQTSGQSLLLRWELRETEREARTLRGEQAVLKNRLTALTGLKLETLEIPVLEFPETFAAPDAEVDVAHRPDLMLRQAQVQKADAKLKQARAEQVPWFNHVQTSYSDSSDEWDVQVAVSLPLFSLAGSKKNLALAERSLRQTICEVSEEAVSAQVCMALEALTGAVGEWQLHRTELAELAEATRAEIEKLQEFSPSAPAAWLTLEERLVQAEHRLIQTLREVYSAQADLLFVTGGGYEN